MDPATRTQILNVEELDAAGTPDMSRIGCNWYKKVSRSASGTQTSIQPCIG